MHPTNGYCSGMAANAPIFAPPVPMLACGHSRDISGTSFLSHKAFTHIFRPTLQKCCCFLKSSCLHLDTKRKKSVFKKRREGFLTPTGEPEAWSAQNHPSCVCCLSVRAQKADGAGWKLPGAPMGPQSMAWPLHSPRFMRSQPTTAPSVLHQGSVANGPVRTVRLTQSLLLFGAISNENGIKNCRWWVS